MGLFVVVLAIGTTIGLGASAARADQSPPKGNKCVPAEPRQLVELGPEIQGMENRQLRMRQLTIEPGGHIGVHSHKDRPAVGYVLSGTDTVTYADGKSRVLKAGDSTSANHETTHWHENRGKEPIVLLVIDVFHNKKK